MNCPSADATPTITLDLTDDRQLPVSGTFHLERLEFTDS
jgi:hypothetical protein